MFNVVLLLLQLLLLQLLLLLLLPLPLLCSNHQMLDSSIPAKQQHRGNNGDGGTGGWTHSRVEHSNKNTHTALHLDQLLWLVVRTQEDRFPVRTTRQSRLLPCLDN